MTSENSPHANVSQQETYIANFFAPGNAPDGINAWRAAREFCDVELTATSQAKVFDALSRQDSAAFMTCLRNLGLRNRFVEYAEALVVKMSCENFGMASLLAYEGKALPLLTMTNIWDYFDADEEKLAYAHDALVQSMLSDCTCCVADNFLLLSGSVASTVPGDSACKVSVRISFEDGKILSARCPFCATFEDFSRDHESENPCCHNFALLIAFLKSPESFAGCPADVRVLTQVSI